MTTPQNLDAQHSPHAPHESPVVRLGHDLVRAFEHLPRDKAAEEIATHIAKFWEPRMRHDLMAHIRFYDTDLNPLLVRAAEHFVDGDIDRGELREPSGG
ncbi:MAG: formate dehydrogenase subunit delta [Tetrasphaera sp.]